MTHTSEFLELMAGLDPGGRTDLLTRHVRLHGETAMTESLRPLVHQAESLELDPTSSRWEGVPRGLADVFTDGNAAHRELVIDVWNAWVDVVTTARADGTVGIGTEPEPVGDTARRRGPATPMTDTTSRCPSCGVPSAGLCVNCQNRRIHDDHVEYDRQLYEIEQDRIEYDRLRDDRHHDDTSPSYDRYDSYDPGYDPY